MTVGFIGKSTFSCALAGNPVLARIHHSRGVSPRQRGGAFPENALLIT